MCLILFAHKRHPKYKLIIAANRDEFYKRETAPAHYWEDEPNVLAGRDMEAGGTWMGVNKQGKISLLTNFRDLSNIKPEAPSRGHLVSDFLINDNHAGAYLERISEKGNQYNGFNIICGTADEMFYYGNHQSGVHKISPGIHGLSNALLDTDWPKVLRGKEKLGEVISKSDFKIESLFAALYDDIKAPKDKLPNTGVGLEKEEMLSPMFIKSPEYGSRCSTILLVDMDNKITFVERTYNTRDFSYQDRNFTVSQ